MGTCLVPDYIFCSLFEDIYSHVAEDISAGSSDWSVFVGRLIGSNIPLDCKFGNLPQVRIPFCVWHLPCLLSLGSERVQMADYRIKRRSVEEVDQEESETVERPVPPPPNTAQTDFLWNLALGICFERHHLTQNTHLIFWLNISGTSTPEGMDLGLNNVHVLITGHTQFAARIYPKG